MDEILIKLGWKREDLGWDKSIHARLHFASFQYHMCTDVGVELFIMPHKSGVVVIKDDGSRVRSIFVEGPFDKEDVIALSSILIKSNK